MKLQKSPQTLAWHALSPNSPGRARHIFSPRLVSMRTCPPKLFVPSEPAKEDLSSIVLLTKEDPWSKIHPQKRPSNLKASQRPKLGNHWAKLTFQSVPLRPLGTLRNCKKARKHWLGTLGTLETGPPGRRSPPSDLRPLASSPESLREPKRGSVYPCSEKSEVKRDQETPREARRGFKKIGITTVPIGADSLRQLSHQVSLASDSFRQTGSVTEPIGAYWKLSEAIGAETTFFPIQRDLHLAPNRTGSNRFAPVGTGSNHNLPGRFVYFFCTRHPPPDTRHQFEVACWPGRDSLR